MRATLFVVGLAVLGVPILARDLSQPDPAWRDPSPHQVRWITVDSSIRLEVLDWEGSGPPLVCSDVTFPRIRTTSSPRS